MSDVPDDILQPFNRANYKLQGSAEEDQLVFRAVTKYFIIASIPFSVVNLTAFALFKAKVINPKYRSNWSLGVLFQTLFITAVVLERTAKDVSAQLPRGFMAQMRYLRTHPESMKDFKAFKSDVRSGKINYQQEKLIDSQIFSSRPSPPEPGSSTDQDKHSDSAETVTSTDENKPSTDHLQSRADLRFKLYRARLKAEPVPHMDRHTCFKAREDKYRLPAPPPPPSQSAQLDMMQGLNLYDPPVAQSLQRTRLRPPNHRKQWARSHLDPAERDAIEHPVNSYRLWRLQTQGLAEPLSRVETCRGASCREWRLASDLVHHPWQWEEVDREYEQRTTKHPAEEDISENKENQPPTQPLTAKTNVRRNIYGDVIEPDLKWQNR